MTRHRYAVVASLCAFMLFASACGNSGDPTETSDPRPTDTRVDDSEDSTGSADTADNSGDPTDADVETDAATDTDDTESTDVDAGNEDDEPVDDRENLWDRRNEFVAIEGVPGVSDDEISVAVVGIREFNPLGTCILDCYLTGVQAYFDYVNDGGGIYGRDLVIGETHDDQLLLNQQAALEIISDNKSFASFQATLNASGWGDLHEAGIPSFTWNIHSTESADRDTIFGHFAIGCINCSQRGVPWLMSISGASTVATLGYGVSENSQVCANSLADSVELYSEELGISVGYINDNLAYGLTSGIAPEVTQMIDAGVDFIATCLDLNGMKTLAQELQRQGARDQTTMYHPNTYDAGFVAEAGSLFDGDYVIPQFAAFEYDTGSELKALYDEWVPRHGGPVAEQTMVGWINADTMVTGLLHAGPDFDRQKLIDALNSIIYDADGLINPIEFGRQHTPPTEGDPTHDYVLECTSAVRMQDGGFVGFQEAPFMCWDNATTDWSEPFPVNFADR
ncbi:MAG: ABC transporter substrate-binding protein [Acidimicrobiaceae bacterium]|nr:ABC transporter substrate-binding protein [Acidimicrobiaceae bacterium]MXW74645.1 ABC transporter substrate-binding protein [Acidimicrobiaceae bacterium]MYD05351.1 ABC transporter substrate-binding protein [Acidimicrobiaceae bacterium]MYI57816.1 ABC transporter substrate-binding protein [Acidimicrobiaceae bacterium]